MTTSAHALPEPLVSVCIPTHNRSARLERAIGRLRHGSYRNLDIVISDNASADGTRQLVEALAQEDSRIRYFRQTENIGAHRNFEFCRAQAQGKYFLWLADDDYPGPDYIRTCVEELERDPELLIVSGLGAYHHGDGRLVYFDHVTQPDSDLPLLRAMKFLWSVWDNSLNYGLCRREPLLDCRFPNTLGGDWSFIAEVLLRGRVKLIPTNYFYREIGGLSLSRRRIAACIGAPPWHQVLPSLALSLNVAHHLAFEAAPYRERKLARLLVYLCTLTLLLLKEASRQLRMLAARVPLAKKIYRKHFKKISPPESQPS